VGPAARRENHAFRGQVYGSVEDRHQLLRLSVDAVEIEARGTFCPEPIIRLQNGMRELAPGTVAVLLADDAGVEVDVPAWCISTGNEFLGLIREPHLCRVLVRRAVGPNLSRSGT